MQKNKSTKGNKTWWSSRVTFPSFFYFGFWCFFISIYVSYFFICCLLLVTRMSSVEHKVEALVRILFQQHNSKVLSPLLKGLTSVLIEEISEKKNQVILGIRINKTVGDIPHFMGWGAMKTEKHTWADILKKIFFVFFRL